MADYTRKKTRKPPALLYGMARGLIRLFCYVVLGYRVRHVDPVPAAGPLVVLGSHAGMFDALFMAAAIRRPLNFVTTERFFHIRGVGALFRLLGVIPRIQFQADPRSISAMLRVTRAGGAIGLFPAGQTSMCGVPALMPVGIARLLKHSGATVAVLRTGGSFFTKSRFQSGFNRGRVMGEVSVLYTPQALEAASEAEVYRAVCDALHYDDYAWQEETGVRFRGPGLARGYETVLYCCPQCGAEYRMASRGDVFQCMACGNAARVGDDMHMTAVDEDGVIFATMRDWYAWQAGRLYAAIDDASRPFLMEEAVAAQLYRGAKRYDAGDGVLRIDREHIAFEGELLGRPADFQLAHRNLFGVAADTGVYLELYHPQLGLVRFLPRNSLAVTALKTAQEYLYGKSLP